MNAARASRTAATLLLAGLPWFAAHVHADPQTPAAPANPTLSLPLADGSVLKIICKDTRASVTPTARAPTETAAARRTEPRARRHANEPARAQPGLFAAMRG